MKIIIVIWLGSLMFSNGRISNFRSEKIPYDDTEDDVDAADDGSAGSATIPDGIQPIQLKTKTYFKLTGPFINATLNPPTLRGTDCFIVFAAAFGNANLLKERNNAYDELKRCLKKGKKCSFRHCNEKLDKCMERTNENEKYKCWFFFFNCGGGKCNK